jgi:hypothetical protein
MVFCQHISSHVQIYNCLSLITMQVSYTFYKSMNCYRIQLNAHRSASVTDRNQVLHSDKTTAKPRRTSAKIASFPVDIRTGHLQNVRSVTASASYLHSIYDLKVCDEETSVQILCFWTLSIVPLLSMTPSSLYFKTLYFRDWNLSPSSCKTYADGPNQQS